MSVQLVSWRPPRIAMGLVFVATVASITAPMPMHAALPVGGGVVAAGGFWLMLRAWWLFRQAGTAVCPTASASSLITVDVFSLTRNPMYLGITLMLVGPGLSTGEPAFYVSAAAYFLVMDRVFCPFEERKSTQEFGVEYTDYARRVRRWL